MNSEYLDLFVTHRFQVFGVAPPQTLYHPRAHGHAYSSSGLIIPPASMIRSSSAGAVEPSTSNTGQSRPPSRELLLPKRSERDVEVGDVSGPSTTTGRPRGASLVYTHYEHSLISLGDILDRVN